MSTHVICGADGRIHSCTSRTEIGRRATLAMSILNVEIIGQAHEEDCVIVLDWRGLSGDDLPKVSLFPREHFPHGFDEPLSDGVYVLAMDDGDEVARLVCGAKR